MRLIRSTQELGDEYIENDPTVEEIPDAYPPTPFCTARDGRTMQSPLLSVLSFRTQRRKYEVFPITIGSTFAARLLLRIRSRVTRS